MTGGRFMQPKPEKDQNTYLKEMLDSAKKAVGYVRGQTFAQFWEDQKTRDAVAMRLHVVGEAAKHVKAETAVALPKVPFVDIRGMRNRIAHDYGSVNFRIVWKVTKEELSPLISELDKYLQEQAHRQELARKIEQAHHLTVRPPRPKQGPRMGM